MRYDDTRDRGNFDRHRGGHGPRDDPRSDPRYPRRDDPASAHGHERGGERRHDEGRNDPTHDDRAGRSQWGGYEGTDFRSAQRHGGDDDFGASGGPEPGWYRAAGHMDLQPYRQGSAPWSQAGTRRTMPKNYQRSDERILEEVCERLSRSGLDVSDVSVHVTGGHVLLEGTVAERRVKHAIEDYVDDCSGVQDIDNRIRVRREGQNPGATPQLAEGGSGTAMDGGPRSEPPSRDKQS